MNQTIRRMLEEEYVRTLEEASHATTENEETRKLRKLTELHKQIMDEIEIDNKCYIDMQKLSLETKESEMKEQQAKENKVLSVIKIVVDGIADCQVCCQ